MPEACLLKVDVSTQFEACVHRLRNLSEEEIDAMILRRGIQVHRGHARPKRVPIGTTMPYAGMCEEKQ